MVRIPLTTLPNDFYEVTDLVLPVPIGQYSFNSYITSKILCIVGDNTNVYVGGLFWRRVQFQLYRQGYITLCNQMEWDYATMGEYGCEYATTKSLFNV